MYASVGTFMSVWVAGLESSCVWRALADGAAVCGLGRSVSRLGTRRRAATVCAVPCRRGTGRGVCVERSRLLAAFAPSRLARWHARVGACATGDWALVHDAHSHPSRQTLRLPRTEPVETHVETAVHDLGIPMLYVAVLILTRCRSDTVVGTVRLYAATVRGTVPASATPARRRTASCAHPHAAQINPW
jgi:hypothetical protein